MLRVFTEYGNTLYSLFVTPSMYRLSGGEAIQQTNRIDNKVFKEESFALTIF